MGSIFRVRTQISGGSGSPGLSTMYFGTGGTLTEVAAATAVHDFWDAQKAHISNNITLQVDPLVYTINDATGSPTGVAGVSIAPVVGTDATDEEPWSTQGLIEWHTGNFLAGREIQGRTFIPTPGSGQGSGGAPTASYLSVANAAAVALINDVNSELVVYSRKNATSILVTAPSVWSKWAVLRSRRD